MPKALRLKRAEPPSRTWRESGEFFSVSGGPSQRSRIACAVSKKVAAKAHERNLLKRRARAVLRSITPLPKAALLFSAKVGASQANYQEIERDLKNIMKKIKVRHSA